MTWWIRRKFLIEYSRHNTELLYYIKGLNCYVHIVYPKQQCVLVTKFVDLEEEFHNGKQDRGVIDR